MTRVEERRRSLVDEYAGLHHELSPLKPKLRRMEELAKVIRSWHEESPAESLLTCAGNAYEVILSPRSLQTWFAPMGVIYRVLGKRRFLRVVETTLKALEVEADAETVAELTGKRPTGSRALTVREVSAYTKVGKAA